VLFRSEGARALYGRLIYTASDCRWTPFFIGLAMAVYWREENKPKPPVTSPELQVTSTVDVADPPPSDPPWTGPNVHWFTLTISAAGVVVLLSAGVMGYTHGPKIVLDFFMSVGLRPLLTLIVACVLYRCLVSEDHPLHWRLLSKFLSLRLFCLLEGYTYGIYMVHFRIMIELMFGYLRPEYLDGIFGTRGRGHMHLFTYVVVIYFCSLAVAYLMKVLIENPVMAWVKKVTSTSITSPMDQPSQSVYRDLYSTVLSSFGTGVWNKFSRLL